MGVVIQDWRGRVVASLSKQAPLPFSPDIVEAMAATRVISFAQELGTKPFILKGDLEAVINTFNLLKTPFVPLATLLLWLNPP